MQHANVKVKGDSEGLHCASDDSTGRGAFVRLGAWRHT